MSDKFQRGFIALSRDVIDSSLWQLPPDHFRVAAYLLLKARSKKRHHNLPDGTTVGRGELVTSMLLIAENCAYYENRTTREMSRKKVLIILQNLESIGFIKRNSHRKGTHISICNYDSYQEFDNYKLHKEETNGKQSGNTEGTQRDTNKQLISEEVENEKPPSISPKGECDLLISALEEPRQRIIKSWVDHKRENRKPYKPMGLKALITKLSKYSDEVVEKSIEDSMSNGWAGLFPEKVDAAATAAPVGVVREFGWDDEGWEKRKLEILEERK